MNVTDPAEPDLAWRGYSGWAMLPSFAICFLLSAAALTARWFFEDVREFGERSSRLIFFSIAGVIWGVQISRWLYRGSTYIYRLTPRHLYIDRGFRWPPEPPVDLTKVTKVEFGSNLLARLVGAGWVCVYVEGREPVCMSGLLQPSVFAEEIEATVKKAQAPNPSGAAQTP